MTAKEKAKEIFDKFLKLHLTSNQMKFRAIDSSILLVNEILNAINPFGQFLGKDYWEEVKQEIEKL
jgi:hypothetical protein